MSLETDLARLEEKLVAQRELFDEKLRDLDKALVIASSELARRLGVLNNAHEKAIQVQNTYVTQEVHKLDVESLRKFMETRADGNGLAIAEMRQGTEQRFGRIESFQAKVLGGFALVAFIVPFVLFGLNRAL